MNDKLIIPFLKKGRKKIMSILTIFPFFRHNINMNHLHTCLYLEKNGIVQVSLDSPGNVYLMKDIEYRKYLEGKTFEGYGGLVKTVKKQIRAPKEGKWHLIIDNNDRQESINVALNISNGRQIAEYEMSEPQENQDESITGHEQEKNEKSDKEQQKQLIKEITKKLKELNKEDIEFLINQAKTIVHNQETEELNKEMKQYQKKLVNTDTQEELQNTTIDIEEQSENVFILVLHGVRKVLSRQELREIVKICHLRINDAAFSEQLYEWLKIRRNDILFDTRIRSANHPSWPALRRFLRNRFKIKK